MLKKFLLFIFFTLLTFVLSQSLFHSGVPVTHDGNNHLVRFANYYIAVKEMQIPPRLAPNLVNRYGYPVFNYNYPLANIISLPFSVLGFHYELTYKIIMIVFVFLGIVGAYKFLTNFKFSKKAKIFALTLFTLSPYVLTNIVYRGNIGEVMSWAILTWIFHYLFLLKKEQSPIIFNQLFLKLFIFLVMFFLAHNIMAFFGSALIFVFLFFYFKNDFTKWKKFLICFLLSFSACLWFWLPAMMEKNLVTMDRVDLTQNFYKHFPTLAQLFSPQINFGYSYWGSVDSMSFNLGFVQTILLFLLIIYLLKNFQKPKQFFKNKVNIFILLSFALVVFQLKLTKSIYQLIPFTEFIQFPWRLILLFSIVFLPVSAHLFDQLKKSWKIFLSILLIIQFSQLFSIKAIDYQSKNKVDYEAYSDTTSVNKENLPQTFVYERFNNWQPSPEIIEGDGVIIVDKWRGSVRTYRLNLNSDSLIIEPTAYFPGWQTKVKNVDSDKQSWQTIEHLDNKLIAGRLAYRLPAGNYLVESRFTQKTWPRIVGNGLSLFSFLLLICFYVLSLKKEKNKERK